MQLSICCCNHWSAWSHLWHLTLALDTVMQLFQFCLFYQQVGYSVFITLNGLWCADMPLKNKKLSYRRVTARCVLSVVILPIATQQCRSYLYDKSGPNWWYEVGGLVGGNVSWTMCTQPWRNRVGSHCLRCHKQTDDGRVVYITCIPTTCCGEIFYVHNVEIVHVTLTTPS